MIYQSVKTPLCDYLQTTSLHYWLENKIHVAMTNILATESRQTLKVGTKMANGFFTSRQIWICCTPQLRKYVLLLYLRGPSGRCPESLGALSGLPQGVVRDSLER